MNTLYDRTEINSLLLSKEVIDVLNKYNITTLCVFGSLITDDFTEISDVDLAVVGDIKFNLNSILELELFFEKILKRDIDIIDLKDDNLDLLIKVNILNTCNQIYTTDNNRNFNVVYNLTDKIYNENENFMYFRKVDLLS